MNEAQLSIAPIMVELGVPVIAAVLYGRLPYLRKYIVVMVGAVTPMLVLYGAVTISYLINPMSPDNIFSFHAMWVMSFILYCVLMLCGLIASFIPWPAGLCARFFLGLIAAPLTYGFFRIFR